MEAKDERVRRGFIRDERAKGRCRDVEPMRKGTLEECS